MKYLKITNISLLKCLVFYLFFFFPNQVKAMKRYGMLITTKLFISTKKKNVSYLTLPAKERSHEVSCNNPGSGHVEPWYSALLCFEPALEVVVL